MSNPSAARADGTTAARLRVKWVKSAIGYSEDQKRTLRALGFRRLGQVVEHNDTPQVRGMLNSVKHLIQVQMVD